MSEPTLRSELPSEIFEAPGGLYRLCAKPAGFVALALGRPGGAPPRPGVDFSVRAAGPDAWLIVGENALDSRALRALEAELGLDLIDQSHGRERLEISGPGAARRLATGTAVNLSPQAFPVGAACETLYGPVAVHLTRTAAQTFEILVSRSLAANLWRTLA